MELAPHERIMRDQTTRRGRYSRNARRRPGRNGRRRIAPGAKRRRNVNGNRITGGRKGEPAACIKCGHPAPDGKLCAFHRQLLNTFRKEMPEQDPRRFRF